MTELSDALRAKRSYPDGIDISLVEYAAATTSLHLSTCTEPYLQDCTECLVVLSLHRVLIDAVRPVIEGPLRRALELIGTDCANYIGDSTCVDSGRTPDAKYGADRWCHQCVARVALVEIEK